MKRFSTFFSQHAHMSLRPLLRLAVVTAAILTVSPLVHGQSQLRVSDLRCEHLTEALGVDAQKPRLSWKLQSEKRGQKQSAYRVIVASTKAILESGRGDVWDSGKVDSDATLEVRYDGKPLQSGTRYHWQVKVWDVNQKESAPGKPSWFETGLLETGAWTAKWIGANVKADASPMLRKSFTLTKPLASARLYICGLGMYEASLNGKKIGDRLLESPDTQYNKRNYYTTFDVTGQLVKGGNALGVELGHGFYDIAETTPWAWNNASWRDHPKCIVQLNLVYADGSRESVVSDETWKVWLDGPTRRNSIYFGEDYDATKEVPGWNTAGFADSAWTPAVAVRPPGPKDQPPALLCAHLMPPIRVIQTKKPAAISEPKPGVFIYDVGHITAGWIRFSGSAPAGTKINVVYHEKLENDKTVKPVQYSGSSLQNYNYTFKGTGVESFEPKFSYGGYRYVQVTGYPAQLTLNNAEVRVVHQDVEVIGKFTCSNPLINQLHENQVRTLLNNFYNKPTDTPMYEKNGWTGDFNFARKSALYNFDLSAFLEKWFHDVGDSQAKDGTIREYIPHPYPGGGANAPPWSSFFLLVPWDMHLFSGDRQVIEEHYEGIKKHGDFLWNKLDANKLASAKTFGPDWQCPHNENPPEGSQMAASGHTYGYIQTLAEAAKLLGKENDAAEYERRAQEMKNSLNTLCYDPATKSYKTDMPAPFRQTTNLLPFGFGFIPEDRKADVSSNIAKDVMEVRGGHLETGCIGTQYILPVLTDNGHGEVAYQIITKTKFPSWGLMAQTGTNWESWGLGARSRDHFWLGTYEEWLYSHLAGIRPFAPGFKEITFKPYLLGDLTSAAAELKTVRGLVASTWTRDKSGLAWQVIVPPNATAIVHVPTSDPASVMEGGLAAAKAPGIRHLRDEKGYAVFSVPAGNYHFTAH